MFSWLEWWKVKYIPKYNIIVGENATILCQLLQ